MAVLSSRKLVIVVSFSMDPILVGTGILGFALGWNLKSFSPDPVPPTPCNCECVCTSSSPETSGWGQSGLILTCCIGLLGLLAHAALAFKVTVVSGGQSREVAFSVKGKSKGIYHPIRGFELTG